MTELCDHSAVSLADMIAKNEISPVTLLESCIARIAQVNPAVNAIVANDFDQALADARQAEGALMKGNPLGPLHGLPIGIKDLNATAGLKTTFGSLLHANHVPDVDDGFVAAIRAAGAIITAKTNTPEFGAGANTINQVYGFTANPFDLDRICGGSSGGSAVALATSMLPLATGSDLGGSLRIPAAYCGIVGYRPTPGLIPDIDKRHAWAPLWVTGPMARSVGDLSLALSALVGQNLVDPLSFQAQSSSFTHPEPVALDSLKVALSEDLGFAPVDASIRRVFLDRCARFSEHFAATEQADPDLATADDVFNIIRAVGFVGEFKEIAEKHAGRIGSNVATNVDIGMRLTVDQIAWAMAEHTRLYRKFYQFMQDYDILICPTTSVPPFSKDQLFPTAINGKPLENYISWCALTYGLTITDHPVVVLPCGLDETGAPFGLQIVGRRNQDARLLAIARGLEAVLADTDQCNRPIPDLSAITNV